MASGTSSDERGGVDRTHRPPPAYGPGIAIRGYAKAKRWGRKRKRSARLDSIASECEEVDENDEKEKETIHSLTA